MAPPQMSDLKERIVENSQYYLYNYLIILILLSVVTVLVSPLAILGLISIAGGYMYLFVMNPDPIVVKGATLDNRGKSATLGVFSLLVLWLTGAGGTFMTLVGVVGAVALLHAMMRKAPSEADFETAYAGGSAQV